MVFIDSYCTIHQVFKIGIDDYKGGQLAAHYLLKHGHRKLSCWPTYHLSWCYSASFRLFLWWTKQTWSELKPTHHFVVDSDIRPEAIIEIGEKIAAIGWDLTAAFVSSDQVASYLIRGLQIGQRRVPEDFSVIGFVNLMISRHMTPQLTTIAQDLEQKAIQSVALLFKQLKYPGLPAELLVLDVVIIER